ncbi:SIMPL domain-containing protein [Stenotrophomonas nitritireducens]|uniref:SIMPL domain-containing protein n=1 Tax=Stenotrophomonas nitritireducens TaxID=83617 RepID=UPI003D997F05
MKLSNMLLWSSLLLAAVPQAWGQASAIPSQPHLLVKGEAKREVMPDRFGINITLRSIDKDPGLARERAQANATKILAAFKAQHALPNSVQASALSITPEYRYEERTQVFSGTRVQRSLAARFKSLEDVRRLLAGLQTSEELQVSGLTTSYSNEAAVRAELKRQAAQQTRESARRLADAYGVQLGGLYTITEVAPNFSYGIEAGRWPGLPAPPPAPLIDVPEPRPNDVVSEALEAGSLTLSENIYAIFLIAQ